MQKCTVQHACVSVSHRFVSATTVTHQRVQSSPSAGTPGARIPRETSQGVPCRQYVDHHMCLQLLLTPQREVIVELVITRDSGEIETFQAYRVQHDDSRGPFKGGLRYHPQVDLDDVRRSVTIHLDIVLLADH